MRRPFLAAAVLVVAWSAAANAQPKIGDAIVIVQPEVEMKVGEETVDKAFLGQVHKVEGVDGDWLWITNKKSGWIPASAAVPDAESVARLAALAQQSPRDPKVLAALGYAHRRNQDLDGAIDAFSKALEAAPTAVLHNARGWAYLDKGQFDQAIADFDKSLKLDPKSAIVYANRGDARYGKKEYAKAAADYAEAVKLDPKLARAQDELAMLRASCVEEKIRDGKAAVDAAKKACALEPDNWRYASTLAAAYAEAGDFGQAVKTQEKALAMQGVPAEARKYLEERLAMFKAKKPFRRK